MTAKKKENQRQMMTHDAVHRCVCHKRTSLGPLSFHSNVNGRLITLSDGGRRATRDESSFRHGLVFNTRPVKIREKMRLRVEDFTRNWQNLHGSLRVGFANALPEELPSMAVPDLTDSSSLYAAAILHEDTCYPGSEMEFWIDKYARICIRSSDGITYCQTTDLNIHWPIWAMIDIYGQTSAVMLMGSKKKGRIFTYRSCPALKHNKHTDDDNCVYEILESLKKPISMQDHESDNTGTEAFDSEDCVVCYSEKPNTLLSCGHKCFCTPCAMKIYAMYGTCPLCRQCIQPIQILASGHTSLLSAC